MLKTITAIIAIVVTGIIVITGANFEVVVHRSPAIVPGFLIASDELRTITVLSRSY
jgi:hypothetical protein